MFTKTMIALFVAIALSASFGTFANAQTSGHGCVPNNVEEGYRSAIPTWRLC
jgi:hypothetical protein